MWVCLLIYFWLCWVFVVAQAVSLAVVSRGNALVVVHVFLIVVASLVAEHRLQSMQALAVAALGLVVVAPRLQNTGSVAAAHQLRCPVAHGILPDQGSKPRPLCWQANSQPLTTRELCSTSAIRDLTSLFSPMLPALSFTDFLPLKLFLNHLKPISPI